MRKQQLESMVFGVVDRIKRGESIEDSHIELKREWPDVEQGARQIAGLANAARGEAIVLLIGIDEKRGAVGAPFEELSNWYSSIESHFEEGVAPEIETVVNVQMDAIGVVAMCLRTDRAPYMFMTGHGKWSREVPWRHANSTRSIKRRELIDLLLPLAELPVVDFQFGLLEPEAIPGGFRLELFAELYIVPRTTDRISIPFHRCRVTCTLERDHEIVEFDGFSLSPVTRRLSDEETVAQQPHRRTRMRSLTIETHAPPRVTDSIAVDDHQVIVSAPGMLTVQCVAKFGCEAVADGVPQRILASRALSVTISLAVAECDFECATTSFVANRGTAPDGNQVWMFRQARASESANIREGSTPHAAS